MTACAAHPDREGTAPCDACSAPMCDRCIDHAPAKWPGRCVACKAKDPKPLRVPQPLVIAPLPPLPKNWVFRILALVLLLTPALPILAAAAIANEPPYRPRVPSPAHIGVYTAMASAFVACGLAALWTLLCSLILLTRWRLARFLYLPYFAALAWFFYPKLGTYRGPSPLEWCLTGYCAAMIAFLLFSKDLKAALAR